jgi:hypothetical protein
MGRWGEKVPAAVGTVGDGFVLSQGCALRLERAWLPAEGTGPSAIGAGLLLAQGIGLLLEKGLQRALGESGSGGEGDLFHRSEIDVESGPAIAKGASGDDFAPLGGEAAEFVDFLGGQGAACHDGSCLGVATRMRVKVVPVKL